jgi:Flp pilus assembly pilin Flp
VIVLKRRGVQLVEEALLLVVAIVTLSLLVGGIQGVLTKAGDFTSSIWTDISKALDGLFGFLWHW